MKSILVGLAFMAIVVVKVNSEWQPPSKDEYKVYEFECQDQSKSPDLLQTFKCTLKCLLEKAGIFDEKHGFDEERIIKTLGVRRGFKENVAREIIGRCDLKKGDSGTVCDWADRGITCIDKEERKVEKTS